jgi:hypothetical protein
VAIRSEDNAASNRATLNVLAEAEQGFNKTKKGTLFIGDVKGEICYVENELFWFEDSEEEREDSKSSTSRKRERECQ